MNMNRAFDSLKNESIKFINVHGKSIFLFISGAFIGTAGHSAFSSKKEQEKERLYEKKAVQDDAVIKDLQKEAEKIPHLEKMNESLEEALRRQNTEAAGC